MGFIHTVLLLKRSSIERESTHKNECLWLGRCLQNSVEIRPDAEIRAFSETQNARKGYRDSVGGAVLLVGVGVFL